MICGAITGGVFKSTLGILPVFFFFEIAFLFGNSFVLDLFWVELVWDALLMLLIF